MAMANGSTTITDSSSNAVSVIPYGNTAISTAQSKFGGSSIYFDGTGDYALPAAGAGFTFGLDAFTIETWIYLMEIMLYSFRQQRPAPLPNRIRLSNGFTRYAHQPPTAEEILDAGYVAYTEPAYDAATEQLLWVDGAYVIEALPPPIPTPRWVDFSAIVMSLPAINVMLGAVLQAAPGLYGGLVVGLQNASEGDSRVFLNSWNAAFAMGLLSAELIVTVQEIATEYDLPEAFIEALEPTQ
jgi:hypothetical protein